MTIRSCANWETLSVERHMAIQCQVGAATFRKVKRAGHTNSLSL